MGIRQSSDILDQIKGQTEDIEVAPCVRLLGSTEEPVIDGGGRLCNGSVPMSKVNRETRGHLRAYMGTPSTVYPDMHKAFLLGLYQRRIAGRTARSTHMNASREEKVSSM